MAKTPATGAETNKGDGGWFPQIIFEPQIQGPRNRSAEEDVIPTTYYDARTMPKFRGNPGPGDIEMDSETPGSDYPSGLSYADQNTKNRSRFGGSTRTSINPKTDKDR